MMLLVRPGDTVFDVGANRGTKTAGYLARGAKSVVCFEPQCQLAAELRIRFAGSAVSVEECALGSSPHEATMYLCAEADTISTLDPKWMTGRFRDYSWNGRAVVRVETLDRMIEKYGRPEFVKIDVEGYEREVLSGLSTSVRCASVEFSVEFIEDTRACVERLCALGMREFNAGRFEAENLLLDTWVGPEQILALAMTEQGGDIYGRVPP